MLSKEELSKSIGSKVRQFRNEKRISMETLAFDSGIEFRQLGRIERGEINTTIFSLYRIAFALEVNICDIIDISH